MATGGGGFHAFVVPPLGGSLRRGVGVHLRLKAGLRTLAAERSQCPDPKSQKPPTSTAAAPQVIMNPR